MRKRPGLVIIAITLLPILGFIVLAKVSDSKRTRLCITNAGPYPVQDLVVIFPGSQIAFGTVPPGATTAYEYVPKGVYRYAAYEYKVRGKADVQPVIDFTGEKPMAGVDFTYTIIVHPQPHRRDQDDIETVRVTKDR